MSDGDEQGSLEGTSTPLRLVTLARSFDITLGNG